MMDHPKVFDMEYQEKDFQYAKNKYGVAYRRAEVAPGQKVYRLVKLLEKTGHHSLITQVLNEDGQPMANVRVVFYWPDAPQFPFPSPHDWHDNFEVGLTNLNGEVGPGMGSGAWIDVDPNPPHHAIECGPHKVWIHDPDIPSDICECLGMRGGTNHDHLDQVFQLTIEPDNGDDDGNGNGDGNGDGDGDGDGDEPCGWTMNIESIIHKQGTRLLIGKGLPHGTMVTAKAPWGHEYSVKAGSKSEHGPGGFEFPIWHPAVYTVMALGCVFTVEVDDDEIVTCKFVEGEPSEPQVRVVSDWMDKGDAELLLLALEDDDYIGFSIEEE